MAKNLDAQQINTNNNVFHGGDGDYKGQNFTIIQSGILASVKLDLRVTSNGSGDNGFRFQIWNTDGSGFPTGTALWTENKPATFFTTSQATYEFDVSSVSISVTRGDRLAITWTNDPDGQPWNSNLIYSYYYNSSVFYGSSYSNALTNTGSWVNLSNFDHKYEVYVTAAGVDIDQNTDSLNFTEQLGTTQNHYCAQTFEPTQDLNLSSIVLRLKKDFTEGNTDYRVQIWGLDGANKPNSGDVIATSDTVSRNDMAVGEVYHFAFDFSTPPTLLNGTSYAIVLQPVWGGTRTRIRWYRSDNSDLVAGERMWESFDAGSTWAGVGTGASDDGSFRIYFNPPPVVVEENFPINANLAKAFKINANLLKTQTNDFPINSVLFETLQFNFPINSYLVHEDNKSRHKITFTFNQDGTAFTETNLDGGRMIARKSRVSRIFLYLKDTGDTGSDTVVDINVNGASLFTSTPKPTISGNSSVNLIGVIPDTRNINSNSVITVDVDSVANNAEDISVIVELNTATSYTHEVRRLELLDNGLLIDRENGIGHITSTLQLRIVFDEPMNTSIEPTITWTKDTMVAEPTISSGGTWTSTYERFDTYTTLIIDTDDENFIGTANVKISGAKNIFDEDINEFNLVLDLIDQAIVAFEDTHTNVLNPNTLLLNTQNLEQFRYSLDQVNWSGWTSYVEEIDIDLSSVSIGGPASEGTVTLYVELEDSTGKIITKTATIFYATTINQVQNFTIDGAGKPDWWMLRWNLPSDADDVPIEKFEVFVDDVLFTEIYEIYPLNGSVEDGDDIELFSTSIDNDAREITYTMSAGKCFISDGTEITFSSTTNLVTDHPDTGDRYDLIGVDSSGNLTVINGTEGLVNREVRVFENEFTSGIGQYLNLPRVPVIPEGFLPLYYVRVLYIEFVGAGPATFQYAQVDDTFKISKDKINSLINLTRTDTDQIIKIKATGKTTATSEFTYTFEKSVITPKTYIELEAYTQPNQGGTELQNGEIITADDAPNNIIYLNFVENV